MQKYRNNWKWVSTIRNSFVFIAVSFFRFYHSFHTSIYIFALLSSGMFHKSIQSACLPLPKPFACAHTHTLFFLSVMRYKDHRRGSLHPLIPNISLLSLHLIQVVTGSEEIFSETGLMPETLCGGSVFKFYHSSPLGHIFITHDRPRRREMRKPKVYFFFWG